MKAPPPLFGTVHILGHDRSLARMKQALQTGKEALAEKYAFGVNKQAPGFAEAGGLGYSVPPPGTAKADVVRVVVAGGQRSIPTPDDPHGKHFGQEVVESMDTYLTLHCLAAKDYLSGERSTAYMHKVSHPLGCWDLTPTYPKPIATPP